MSERIVIQSHRGPYVVNLVDKSFAELISNIPSKFHFIVDEKVSRLYSKELAAVLKSFSVLVIEATEANKSLEKFPGYVEHLISRKIRRDHTLIAIGGGIMQDITCFLAATLLRGLSWFFYPTTLLAQADSCIGSKSSINVGITKNILGTFTPPEQIFISMKVLKTLESSEIKSGIGEMLKVHAIESPESFDRLGKDYSNILKNSALMRDYIFRSLEIKKKIIEEDEFDKGSRNIMNYGHSFGHAIESASGFTIPHGIAVSLGMDLANYYAFKRGGTSEEQFSRMHPILAQNYNDYVKTPIDFDSFLKALSKDKKNTDSDLRLILPDTNGKIKIFLHTCDSRFQEICREYFGQLS